jgi:hypothetical protein
MIRANRSALFYYISELYTKEISYYQKLFQQDFVTNSKTISGEVIDIVFVF